MNEIGIIKTAMFRDTEKFDKSLSSSNSTEIAVSVVMILIFLFFAYLFKDNPVLLPIGCIIIAGYGSYIIFYIVKHRSIKGEMPSKDNSLEYFKYWIGWYKNTYRLARNIFWWYAIPFIPGLIMFTIGMAQTTGEYLQTSLTLGLLALITGCFIYWLNRIHKSKKLLKRIDKLNVLIAELESN